MHLKNEKVPQKYQFFFNLHLFIAQKTENVHKKQFNKHKKRETFHKVSRFNLGISFFKV